MSLGGFFRGLTKVSPLLNAIPGVGTIASLGIGVGAGLLANRLSRHGTPNPTTTSGDTSGAWNNRFMQAVNGLQGPDPYQAEMDAFDPTAGFADQTKAQLAAQDESFAKRYANSLGMMVGAGRLPTKSGFGLQDTQDLILQGQRERANIEQQNAAAANQARANWLSQRANYATDRQNRYLDAVSGRMNTLEAQRLQDQADRRRNRAGLLGGIISAAGTLGGAYLSGRRN